MLNEIRPNVSLYHKTKVMIVINVLSDIGFIELLTHFIKNIIST